MFLPFCKFLVKSKIIKKFINKEIYEVELEEIVEINERKNIKSFNISMEQSYSLFDLPLKKNNN